MKLKQIQRNNAFLFKLFKKKKKKKKGKKKKKKKLFLSF